MGNLRIRAKAGFLIKIQTKRVEIDFACLGTSFILGLTKIYFIISD